MVKELSLYQQQYESDPLEQVLQRHVKRHLERIGRLALPTAGADAGIGDSMTVNHTPVDWRKSAYQHDENDDVSTINTNDQQGLEGAASDVAKNTEGGCRSQ